ncbi:MAG: hypothetical protein ACD_72C00054G0003 [uncultured bacterium]|nr:MAG: hypothetical protein ACD_72C00054G0003 [uncultured bacterium]
MNLKQYLVLMATGTALCWISWAFILFNIDPQQAGFLGLSFFYVSLFLGIVGLFSVVGFILKKQQSGHDDVVFRQVKKTFKQGILFGVFVIVTLLLLQANLLFWWNAIILALIYILLEGAIISGRKFNNRDYV